MHRLYQTEWQDIQFTDFTKLSSRELAGAEFYREFYEEFFKRYQNFGQLSASWIQEKECCAKFVLTKSQTGSRILSIGCGIGVMEHYIHAQNRQLDLFIHDLVPTAMRWIEKEFAADHKFLGWIPSCLPDDIRFDLIYLCLVDYALDDDALVGLLAAIRPFLKNDSGRCLLISPDCQKTPATLKEKTVLIMQELKTLVAMALDVLGLRSRGQFWGWIRTKNEYQMLTRRAGYRDIEEGFFDAGKHTYYWISGR
jgi:hypothetical protein